MEPLLQRAESGEVGAFIREDGEIWRGAEEPEEQPARPPPRIKPSVSTQQWYVGMARLKGTPEKKLVVDTLGRLYNAANLRKLAKEHLPPTTFSALSKTSVISAAFYSAIQAKDLSVSEILASQTGVQDPPRKKQRRSSPPASDDEDSSMDEELKQALREHNRLQNKVMVLKSKSAKFKKMLKKGLEESDLDDDTSRSAAICVFSV